MKKRGITVVSATLVIAAVLLMAGSGCSSDSSKGRTIPDLSGMSLEEARSVLGEAGITIEERTQPGPAEMVGKVMGQEPPAGVKVGEDGVVVIVIGMLEQVEVPDVVGLTREEASAKLAELGLSTTLTQQDTSDEALGGIVLTQEPAAGTRLEKQGQVALAVGNYVAPVTSTSSSNGQSSTIVCPACGGSGMIAVPNPPRLETNPDGGGSPITNWDTGSTMKPCNTCGGTGRVQRGFTQ